MRSLEKFVCYDSYKMDSDDDLRDFVLLKVAKNTIRQNEGVARKFERFLTQKGIKENLKNIEAYRLNTLIGEFLKTATKGDGSDYEPDSLTTIHRALARHLEEIKYPFNIVTAEEFNLSRMVVQAKKKELKQKGKGNKPNKAEVLTPEDEEKLWTTGCLGSDFPGQLLSTVWFNNTKFLGFRGNDESRQLKWGDLTLKRDDHHGPFLEWNERSTKTRQGKGTHLRLFLPKMFRNTENPDRCPLRIYDAYASHRPVEMLAPDAPFYLAIKHNGRAGDFVWFKNAPLGVNMLKSMLPKMCMAAGVPGKKTNHSVRRTMINRLLDSGVFAHATSQLAGHKNVVSVSSYAVPNINQQHGMSSVLMGESRERCLPSIMPSYVRPDQLALPATNPRAAEASLPYDCDTTDRRNVDVDPTHSLAPVALNKSQQQAMYGMFAGANISGGSFVFNVEK